MSLSKSFFVFGVILCCHLFSYGQGDADVLKNQLKFSPIKLFDPINPGLEISYERNHGGKFSTQLSVAYLNDFLNTTGYYHRANFEGYRVGVEEKWFFVQDQTFFSRHKFFRIYAGAELVYARVAYQDVHAFAYSNSSTSETYEDTFSVSKQTMAFNAKFGLQLVLKRFVVEASCGVGLKYRDVQHGDRLYPGDRFGYARGSGHIPSPQDLASREGSYYTLSLPLTLKLGYVF